MGRDERHRPARVGGRWRRSTADRDIDLLVLGEVNADIVLSGGAEPAFGQEERLVADGAVVLGGSGAITACGAARLGLRVAYSGLAGDDAIGRFCLDELRAREVDVSGVLRHADLRTGFGVLLIRDDGDRAILTYPGAITAFTIADVDQTLVARARHVHVGAYFLQTGLQHGLGALFAAHRAAGGTTSVDTNWDPSGLWSLGELLREVDILMPNAAEAVQLAGVAGPSNAAARLASAGPAVVVKLGPDGALLRSGDRETRVPGAALDSFADTVGAGDSFDAGYLFGLLTGRDERESMALGCACGALSMRRSGGTAGQALREEAESLAAALR